MALPSSDIWHTVPAIFFVFFHQVIYEAIRSFIGKYGADRTAIDVTPGTKNFSVIAAWAVDPQLTPCLYIGHSWGKQTFAAGKERIRRLLPIAKK